MESHLFRLCVFQLLQCICQLVGATCVFRTTLDASNLGNDIIDVLAAHQAGDSLKVSIATTKEEYLLDDVVLVGCYVNKARTSATCLVLNVLDCHYTSSGFMLV
jgi:hypothetical protein